MGGDEAVQGLKVRLLQPCQRHVRGEFARLRRQAQRLPVVVLVKKKKAEPIRPMIPAKPKPPIILEPRAGSKVSPPSGRSLNVT
jgi:hypothetical protein